MIYGRTTIIVEEGEIAIDSQVRCANKPQQEIILSTEINRYNMYPRLLFVHGNYLLARRPSRPVLGKGFSGPVMDRSVEWWKSTGKLDRMFRMRSIGIKLPAIV